MPRGSSKPKGATCYGEAACLGGGAHSRGSIMLKGEQYTGLYIVFHMKSKIIEILASNLKNNSTYN